MVNFPLKSWIIFKKIHSKFHPYIRHSDDISFNTSFEDHCYCTFNASVYYSTKKKLETSNFPQFLGNFVLTMPYDSRMRLNANGGKITEGEIWKHETFLTSCTGKKIIFCIFFFNQRGLRFQVGQFSAAIRPPGIYHGVQRREIFFKLVVLASNN